MIKFPILEMTKTKLRGLDLSVSKFLLDITFFIYAVLPRYK